MANYKHLNAIPSYTLSDEVILCDLDLEQGAKELEYKVVPMSVRKKRRRLAQKLEVAFKNGGEDYTRDEIKAHHFHEIAEGKPSKHSYATTKNVYFAFTTYTSIRLFFLRFLNLFFRSLQNPLLKNLFAIAGFSYALELFFDVGVILYTTFRDPLTPLEARLSHWQRFKNVLHKDNRISRMANAFVWVNINVFAFIFTGGLSIWLNVGGFIFDICHEVAKAYVLINRHEQVAEKVKIDLAYKKGELETLENEPDTAEIATKKVLLRNDIQFLEIQQASLNKKISSLKLTKVYDIMTMLLIVVGVLLVFFPPTSAAGFLIAGAGLTFAAGSIFNGLGRTLMTSLFSWVYNAFAPKKPTNESLDDDNDDVTPSFTQHSYLTQFKPILNNENVKRSPSPPLPIKKEQQGYSGKNDKVMNAGGKIDASPTYLRHFSLVKSKPAPAVYSMPRLENKIRNGKVS